MNKALLGLAHLGTLENGKLYVFCWGPTDIKLWQMTSNAPTCLHCWVLGPRKGWTFDTVLGGFARVELRGGVPKFVVDTETKES